MESKFGYTEMLRFHLVEGEACTAAPTVFSLTHNFDLKCKKHCDNSVTDSIMGWTVCASHHLTTVCMCLHVRLCAYFRSLWSRLCEHAYVCVHIWSKRCVLLLRALWGWPQRCLAETPHPPVDPSRECWEQFITHTGWGWLLGYCILGSGSKYSSAVSLGQGQAVRMMMMKACGHHWFSSRGKAAY